MATMGSAMKAALIAIISPRHLVAADRGEDGPEHEQHRGVAGAEHLGQEPGDDHAEVVGALRRGSRRGSGHIHGRRIRQRGRRVAREN
jgi:hypothetical protein